MAVSYEESAKYGIQGRILWAIANLGRGPSVQRVYDKANERILTHSKERDDPKEFVKEMNQLLGRGIIAYDPDHGRVSIPHGQQDRLKGFRLKCSRCENRGPSAQTREECVKVAEAEGFTVGEVALCPDCVAGRAKVENRRERRNRERLDKKAARRRSNIIPEIIFPERQEPLSDLVKQELWQRLPGDMDNATDEELIDYLREAFGWDTIRTKVDWAIYFDREGLDGVSGATFREALHEALVAAKARGKL
jgi:hypothetical protein